MYTLTSLLYKKQMDYTDISNIPIEFINAHTTDSAKRNLIIRYELSNLADENVKHGMLQDKIDCLADKHCIATSTAKRIYYEVRTIETRNNDNKRI